MVEQCTDGLSRGNCAEGVMAGQSMVVHVPLNLSCLDRQPKLRDNWISSFVCPRINQQKIEFLSLQNSGLIEVII